MQIMLKGGNKYARIVYDTCSKLSIRTQKQHLNCQFEQLSVIPMVSLLLTFNKLQFREFCLFQYINFMF